MAGRRQQRVFSPTRLVGSRVAAACLLHSNDHDTEKSSREMMKEEGEEETRRAQTRMEMQKQSFAWEFSNKLQKWADLSLKLWESFLNLHFTRLVSAENLCRLASGTDSIKAVNRDFVSLHSQKMVLGEFTPCKRRENFNCVQNEVRKFDFSAQKLITKSKSPGSR